MLKQWVWDGCHGQFSGMVIIVIKTVLFAYSRDFNQFELIVVTILANHPDQLVTQQILSCEALRTSEPCRFKEYLVSLDGAHAVAWKNHCQTFFVKCHVSCQ